MVQKRLAEDEYDVSPKHLKLEHTCDLVPYLQFTNQDAPIRSDKDEGCFFKPVIGLDHGFISDKFTDFPVCTTKDFDYTLPGHLSATSAASSTMGEGDVRSAKPLQIHEDAYSYLLGRSPRKEVPIGREYQADIPEFLPQTSEPHSIGYREHEINLMGSCVFPVPEDQAIHDNNSIGRGRNDCYCRHHGSLRCVRRHIKEAREALMESIGHKTFAELGFGNMGEVVAEKWTEEDEQLFHEVVYSNPVSIGRNFWNHLAETFPSRTNQEIVSYYFNVFVLRRRAEQNRGDPVNVDSDDDELQGSHESDESDKEDYSCRVKISDSTSQPSEKTMVEESGDGEHDFQYDSCTSSDSHDFIFEPSDDKVWDIGYFSCPSTKTDFLPTGSMIEEVFGVESWIFEVADDNKSANRYN